MSKIPELQKKVLFQASSPALGKYIWKYGAGPQMGYSFSVIHALAYSFIAVQTAYLATHWNSIYWNTACLVVNSGSLEEPEETIVNIYEKENNDAEYEDLPDRSGKKKKEKVSDYAKIAKALGDIRSNGINVSLVNINTSELSFKPDIEKNRILFGLKALGGINSEIIEKIKAGRPYMGIKDFMIRCPLNKKAMLSLIKAGAFDEVEKELPNRYAIMIYYIMNNCDAKKKITMQNFNGLIQNGLVPESLRLQMNVFNLNKYLKNKKLGGYYLIDESCLLFFDKYLTEFLDELIVKNEQTFIQVSVWDKIYKSFMEQVKELWLTPYNAEILKKYNEKLFKDTWDKYCNGNTSHWEMESLCFYHGEHELALLDNDKYEISDFEKLSTEPVIDKYYKKGGHEIPIFKLYRIAGTILAKNDTKSTITLLTTTGVVTAKFSKEQYAKFKKQISEVQADGTKKIIEKGWFSRGVMVILTGFRRDDTFVIKTYSNTQFHQIYKINEVLPNGELVLQYERYQSLNSIEEEE